MRSPARAKRAARTPRKYLGPHNHLHINKTIVHPKPSFCPTCGEKSDLRSRRTRTRYDLFFGKCSVKRWVVQHRFHYHWCNHCKRRFGEPDEFWPQSHLGRNLVAYVLYNTIELGVPFPTVQRVLSSCFNLSLLLRTLITIKRTAAKQYKNTYDGIFRHVLTGNLLHIDETHVSVGGRPAYVWVLSNLCDVVSYTPKPERAFFYRRC